MDAEKQENIPKPPPSPNKINRNVNLFFIIPVFLLGVLVGFALNYKNNKISNFNFLAKPTASPIPTRIPTMPPRPTTTPVPSPTPFKIGILTFPTPNATLCRGQNYPIAWLVPPDTQNVALDINPPSGLPHRITIATNPGTANDNNSMKGSYIWNSGENLDNVWLPSGPGYRLAITVFGSGNAGYTNFGNFFTLTSCP